MLIFVQLAQRYLSAFIVLLGAAFLFVQSSILHSELDIRFSIFKEQQQLRFPSSAATQRVDAWQYALQQLAGKSEQQKIKNINKFFHQNIRYQTDDQLYGKNDYWATPLELLGHGLGDCEDWAIAEYVSLRKLGISDQKLRLIYVRASIGGPNSGVSQAHMVLGYYATPNAEPLILDSLLDQVLPASQRDDLSPVFSFNSEGLWAGDGDQKAKSSPTARMSPWRDALGRMQQEGIVF